MNTDSVATPGTPSVCAESYAFEAHRTTAVSSITSQVERYLDPVLVSLVATIACIAVGYRWNAAYPRGDGGLFYAVVREVLASGFHFPSIVHFNGFAIPFAYSPGAFFGCALIAKIFGLPIAMAMNVWVGVWTLLYAVAGVWCARRFGLGRYPSIVAAAVMVALPQELEWLGFGGGITRAPGFAMCVLAIGECWNALGTQKRRDAIVAGVCAGAIGLFHMEFAFLAAVSLVVLCLYRRPRIDVLVIVGLSAIVVTSPWLAALVKHPAAAHHALQTASLQRGSGNLASFLAFFGLNPASVTMASNAGALAIVGVALAAARRETLWAVWVIALFAVDQRAAFQVAHLPVALALGSLASQLKTVPGHRMVNAGIGLAIVGLLCASVDRATKAYRISDAAVADIQTIGRTLPKHGTVLVMPSIPAGSMNAFAADQTFEWFPAFAPQRSLLTYVGLEWVDRNLFNRMWRQHLKMINMCIEKGSGAPCILSVIRNADLSRAPMYVYVPKRASGKLLIAAMEADSRFGRVLSLATADVFSVGRGYVSRR